MNTRYILACSIGNNNHILACNNDYNLSVERLKNWASNYYHISQFYIKDIENRINYRLWVKAQSGLLLGDDNVEEIREDDGLLDMHGSRRLELSS